MFDLNLDVLKGKKAIIVDDEALLREVLCIELDDFGVECVEACNGQEAIDLLSDKSVDYDFIISDIRMPTLSGVEMLELLKKINRNNLKVIMMSGYSDQSLEEVQSLGAETIITKPFDIEQMLSAVIDTLEK